MCDTKDKLIEQANGVLEKTYEDVVHPSAKSIRQHIKFSAKNSRRMAREMGKMGY